MVSPSDLPWWGWLLCSVGAWVVCAVAKGFDDESSGMNLSAVSLSIFAGVIAFATGAVAVIRFVKWVWQG